MSHIKNIFLYLSRLRLAASLPRTAKVAAALWAGVVLVGCGGGDAGGSDYRTGQLTQAPVLGPSLTPQQFEAAAEKQGRAALFKVVGAPVCTVSFYRYAFATRGAKREKVTSTAAVMLPSSPSSATTGACSGARPVLLFAHGTAFNKNKDMADPSDDEVALAAATFAAQGYIVVAPNYAGYSDSTLSYHPYLNMDQQAGEMLHAWQAIREQWPQAASSNGQLFISGYSQGGYVAMATHRELQLAGQPVTASAPMSGPYALLSFVDAIFAGRVNYGATLLAPMLTTSMQKAYGNLYSKTGDIYEDKYAKGIESVLPNTASVAELMKEGKLPQSNLFAADSLPQPQSDGFGPDNLLKTSFRQDVQYFPIQL